MIISKQITPYIVYYEDSIQHALQKISSNTRRLVYCLSETGVLEGLVTDGDFRRWVVSTQEINLQKPVQQITNTSFVWVREGESPEKIEALLSNKITSIPIVDEAGRLTAIAWREEPVLRFGNREIRHEKPAFLIAEIGNNHNGSIDLAKRLVELAAESGADCAKFQLRDMESLYANSGEAVSEDLGSEYTLDLLKRFQLSVDEMFEILDFTRQCGMVPLCTPWDLASLARLDEYGLEGFKIASADLTNHALLEAAARTGKPLLLSTGMSLEQEIQDSVALLKQQGASFALLHCNSTYPAPMSDINLAYLDRLREISQSPVGYSGHERGFEVCIAAVARGAKIIEKHFTVDRNMEGNDHRVSLLPDEFATMVKAIRNVEEAIGSSSTRTISQGERLNREVLAKSLVAARAIRKGEKISEEMINARSPGRGLQPSRLNDLLGISACRDMAPGDVFFESDIMGESAQPRPYHFDRPWGIPVRYHDFRELTQDVPMDFVEIHFSYRDLDLAPSSYFSSPSSLGLVVHSPELFAGDHVMDLSSEDDAYRSRSIAELQRVINRTRDLKRFFPRTERPMIIINAGGFTSDHFLPETRRQVLYDRIGAALAEVDSEGVEIIPQTMPPFPWHFGGQRYHNLFMDHIEIARFCEKYGTRICYDISHSKLACNYFGWSMQHFTRDVGKYVAHLHIVDAKGHHDEGLQIGAGDIDFESLARDLKQWSPGVSFIPEIWQGHKNGGEGFWIALDRLEKSFSAQRKEEVID
ncbi:N-acetylneuraminate synthase family protein [Methylovorus glucosotrophus]|uniref:N-acylneuraminate-9-phosphate synthase n=1 Tax=Methylovorus glucosotrophus (strain SIP3-4) TaxID=582744 RepID=C6X8B2_METGS|nr:N-acetylneuraminate synthase family protein [Methylovorus glucosotrophus]ACT49382.1 N-acylneuraminate-9-phosphate synthase [Methylovorus glucosotrophus SIP3-4]